VTADERGDLLFLHAAGALEGEERDDVDAWLAREGAEARAAYAEAEAEVAELGLALAPHGPSPGVRERLLRRIAQPGGGAAPAAGARWRTALAAGLAALLAGGAGLVAGQRAAERELGPRLAALAAERDAHLRDLAAARAELAAATEERDALDEELAEQESAARSLESDMVLARKTIDVLSARHTEALAMTGTELQPGARARVYWDWDSWYCYLRAEGLAPDPHGVYALWLFTDDGDVISVGTFAADAKGAATLVAPVPHDIGHVVKAGVSVEPDEQLGPGPRGDVVMLGRTG
jgi:hypothetical protein